MKIITALTLISGLGLSAIVHAQFQPPDDLVTKSDINKCFEHLRNTEDFLYPHSLKVESAHYTLYDLKIILTLGISQKTEYGGNMAIQEKQCELDKKSSSNKEYKQKSASNKVNRSNSKSYSYEY